MSRALLPLLLGTLGSGCIIYEERYHSPNPCAGCGVDSPPVGSTDTETTSEPTLTDAVALTVDEGLPGASFLSTLVPVTNGIDLTTVATVAFERDVVVQDTIQRAEEIVLLLEIAADAAPGDVAVFVTTANGTQWQLAEPFHVLPAPGDTGTDSGGSDPTSDTATDSGDTGVHP